LNFAISSLYTNLAKIISREKLFYITIIPFITFFGLFGFIIHPNTDFFHPTKDAITALHAAHPTHSIFIDIYACWTHSIFYILADLWGSIICAFGFWEFANYIFTFYEAKRFYGLFAIVANVAVLASGGFVYFCSESIRHYVPSGRDPWHITIYLLMLAVVLLGIVSVYIYRGMHKNMPNEASYFNSEDVTNQQVYVPKTIRNKHIMRSPELLLIAILIVAWGITSNLIEVQWKEQLRIFYAGDKGGYNGFMGMFSMTTGIFSLVFMFFGIHILRKSKWYTAAIITPAAILICGSLFYIFIIFKDEFQQLLDLFSLNSNAVAVFLGAGTILFIKSVKYILTPVRD
jgi:AAA family ATP:ADP antiporter